MMKDDLLQLKKQVERILEQQREQVYNELDAKDGKELYELIHYNMVHNEESSFITQQDFDIKLLQGLYDDIDTIVGKHNPLLKRIDNGEFNQNTENKL